MENTVSKKQPIIKKRKSESDMNPKEKKVILVESPY